MSPAATATPPNPIAEAAQRYRAAGLSPIPTHPKNKNPLLAEWRTFQARLPTEDETREHFATNNRSVGIVTGKVSGGLEILDFDQGGKLAEPWRKAVEAEAPGLTKKLTVQRTQRGGVHVVYRCAEVEIPGSMKLAQEPDPEAPADKPKPRTLIETRGEGGQFLATPSRGYQLVQGDFEHTPVITAAERGILIRIARSLNTWFPKEAVVNGPPKARTRGGGEKRPGDDFNERGDVRPYLERHGWRPVGRRGDNELWRRPGKNENHSATLHPDFGLYCFTSNGHPFSEGICYSPFAIVALLDHGGDYGKAAAALAREGYGEPQSPRNAAPSVPTGGAPEDEQAGKAGSDTITKIINLLRTTYQIAYRTKSGKLYSKLHEFAYTTNSLWKLLGILEIVEHSPEYASLGKTNARELRGLAKLLADEAGTKLAASLPDESPAFDEEQVEAIKDALTEFLVAGRQFYSQNGIARNESYAVWLRGLEPSDSWIQCSTHPVYGRQTNDGAVRLAVQPVYLLSKSPKLARSFTSARKVGAFLADAGFIEVQQGQRSTYTIKVGSHVRRVWEISQALIEDAVGTPDSPPKTEAETSEGAH